MRRLLLGLILAQPIIASAAELPEEAAHLVPTTWTQPVPTGSSQVDWIEALGGSTFAELLGRLPGTTDVATSEAALQQAGGRSTQAMAGWMPSLSASASWQTGTPNAAFATLAGKRQDVYSASADLNVPLTPWTSVPDQRAAGADRRAALADLDTARATTALDAAAAWLDVVQATEQLALVEDQLALQEQLLAVTEARYAAGEVAGVDVLQQRQQLASTRSDLPAARTAVGANRRALAALLRLPIDALPTLPTQLPEPSVPTIPEPTTLIDADPTVVSAQKSWEAARFRTRSARADFAPTLAATASTGIRFTQAVDDTATPTWSAGVQVNVPLFDGGTRAGSLHERAGAEHQARVALEQAVVDVVLATEDALATYAQAAEVRTTADEAQTLAEDALEAARLGYAEGTATYNTVLTAVQAVRTARQTAIQAQRDHVDAALGLVERVRFTWIDTMEMG